MNKLDKMKELRQKGLTYEEIGNIFKVSRQRIHQLVSGYRQLQSLSLEELIKRAEKEKIKSKKLRERIRIYLKLKEIRNKRIKTGYNTQGIKLQGRDRIREIIRRRDNYTCQCCGKIWQKGMRRFDTHHLDCDKEKTFQYDNWEKENGNMITLCHKCHLNIEEHRGSMQKQNMN